MQYNDLIVLVPCHSLEDFPTELGEDPAASLMNAFSVLWHPALIASTGAFPRWERSDDTHSVEPHRLIIVPTPSNEWVPHSWIERARREGSVVIANVHDRKEMLHQALEPLVLTQSIDSDLVADFLALGTVYLQTELLTRHMRNFSHLDESHMQREVVAAAQAALAHDIETAQTHLTHCFEMLLECRERFYPVDCFLIDLCLVNKDFANDELRAIVQDDIPVNLLCTGQEWQAVLAQDDSWGKLLESACAESRVELLGGEQQELPTSLMSLDATLYQLLRGRQTYQELFDTTPRTWGRKRFGLGTHLPQILSRLGYVGGLHFAMDDGIYPDDEQSKMRWEGCDGTAIDGYSRIPLAADSASSFLRFPVRMSESMDYDHTAAVVFARWPKLRTPWLDDVRRASRYAPVLGKFTTFADFFETSDAPGRMSDFKASGYFSLNLVQAVAREEANPIGRWIDYWTRQRRFEAIDWAARMGGLLKQPGAAFDDAEPLEDIVQAAHPEAEQPALDAADAQLDAAQAQAESTLGELLASRGEPGKGLLIVNPLSFSRKVKVDWPLGQPGGEDCLIGRQIDETGSRAVVDVPACGFTWVSAKDGTPPTDVGKTPLAEELTLRNELFQVELSDVTGGISRIATYRRSPNRLSQQIAFRFPHERNVVIGEGDHQQISRTYYSLMEMRTSRVLSPGPLIGSIETTGDLVDGQNSQPVAHYRQVTTVTRGRPFVDVEVELDLKKTPNGDPWTNYVGLRFAWKHATASLTGSLQQGAHALNRERIESPQYLEIADDDFRTTILTPGLPFHRSTGDRMLDTLLITAGESRRRFQFSVAIDCNYPMQAHLDTMNSPLVIPTDVAPPPGGRQGWLFFVGAANVLLTRILPLRTEPGRDGFIVRLLETEGRTKTFPLRCFRQPRSARQVDFQGQSVHSLKVSDDHVQVEIAPYEICDVEVTF